MMRRPWPAELVCYVKLLLGLIRCLPARSYQAYGEELAGVYRDTLLETYDSANMPAVRRHVPKLLVDACSAVGLEYIDVWRRARLSPPRLAVAALIGAGGVWILVAAAAVGNVRWAAAILDINLSATVSLMLGLPALSLVASRVGAAAGVDTRPQQRSVLGASIAATAITWTIMTCHIVA